MAKRKSAAKKSESTWANLGFEAKLWLVADKRRSNMGAPEYKHVVLGLIFLKYISDAFEEHREKLERETADPDSYTRAQLAFAERTGGCSWLNP